MMTPRQITRALTDRFGGKITASFPDEKPLTPLTRVSKRPYSFENIWRELAAKGTEGIFSRISLAFFPA